MSKQYFTEEQINELRQNPYVFSVTGGRLLLTKEFKELFMTAYNKGKMPREILQDYGFNLDILGERRIWSISCHIREEYKKYGEFHSGYRSAQQTKPQHQTPPQSTSDKDEIKQLRHEVEYLKQEIEFLKKISSIKHTQK